MPVHRHQHVLFALQARGAPAHGLCNMSHRQRDPAAAARKDGRRPRSLYATNYNVLRIMAGMVD
jgi:hypothetical protein